MNFWKVGFVFRDFSEKIAGGSKYPKHPLNNVEPNVTKPEEVCLGSWDPYGNFSKKKISVSKSLRKNDLELHLISFTKFSVCYLSSWQVTLMTNKII